jgi:hypothetical protein
MKGPSERIFREALGKVDIDPLEIYKPPDDARNWKPADFLVWWHIGSGMDSGVVYDDSRSAWIEVKATNNKAVWPFADLQPTQVLAIRKAKRLGIPYFIAIRWNGDRQWSLVDAIRLLDYMDEAGAATFDGQATLHKREGVARGLLESRFGVGCTVGQLASTIKVALIEGL